jgi:putative SOS response-associated peptidase YedK
MPFPAHREAPHHSHLPKQVALRDDREPFAFAEIWWSYRGPVRKDGETVDIDTFAFLTTKPNALVATVHPSWMPVMLVGEEAQTKRLEGTADDARMLIEACSAEHMTIVHEGIKREDLGA